MDDMIFTIQQRASISLMRNDLRYIYTVIANRNRFKSNYVVSSMPFLGLIIDGVENWLNTYNNSSSTKLKAPSFTEEENSYYEKMRSSIKLWDDSYISVRAKLRDLYKLSDEHFASLYNPIERELRLYNFFGVDKADGEFCGNTILCSYYCPDFSYGDDSYGERIKIMSEVAGKYIGIFGATTEYRVDNTIRFTSGDYGSSIKPLMGNSFDDDFVLFSMLCQINFVLYCVEKFIVNECSTKLRFAYLQYYYCAGILDEVNHEVGTKFKMNKSWRCDKFRNSMAHYGVGVALKPEEIKSDDLFYGMTQKFFGCSYYDLKMEVMNNLIDCY